MRDARAAEERPRLDQALPGMVQCLVCTNPERLGHIDPGAILFVAGSARREATASIRPLFFRGGTRTEPPLIKPEVTMDGRAMRYEICLRPRFFQTCTPSERLRILAHELWHIDPSFDGTLAAERRHAASSACTSRTAVDMLVEGLSGPAGVRFDGPLALLAYRGEVTLPAWLSRPPSRIPSEAKLRRAYSEADLFRAIIAQR